MVLLRRHARVQDDRGDERAAGDEPRDQLRGERASGTRHLRAAGLVCVHVLVRGERPPSAHVAVADRAPVLAEVISQWTWKLQASEPEAGTGVRCQDRRGRARRQREALSDLGGTERLVARAQLHVPESIRIAAFRRRREVERERGAVGARCAHRGGERRRRVHDEQVARLQELEAARGSSCGRCRRRRGTRAGARRRVLLHGPRRARPPRAAPVAPPRACSHRDRDEVAGAIGAARHVALDQREEAGDAVLGGRPVGDVLARECVLLHLRAHVPGVDGIDA